MGSFTSHRRFLIACAVILAIAVAVGGCFGPLSGPVIKGHVTELDSENALRFQAGLLSSGQAVSGATVTLVGPESHVTTTNSLGQFTFANVSPGTYHITVWKSGFASAAAYDVRVTSYRTNEVELRMVKPKEGYPVGETNPPAVYVSCPPTVWETGYITVSASDPSGIDGILLFIDNSYVELFDTGAGGSYMSGTYPWDTLSGQSVADNGEHTITAMAIDAHRNIGYRSIVVTVNNIGLPVSAPKAPINVRACAATISYSVIDLLHALEDKYELEITSSLADRILALIKNLNETTSQVRPLAMPDGSSAVAFCQVTWETLDSLKNLTGFKIYRDEVFIGESPAQPSRTTALLIQPRPVPPQVRSYADGSSKLTPNVPVSYRVSAYNRWGEGYKSDSATTTPLSALTKVSLIKPVERGVVVGDSQEFIWSPVTNAKLYAIRIVESLSGAVVRELYTPGNYISVDLLGLGSENDEDYHWYVLAINSIPSPPSNFNPSTWSPSQMSVSASDLGTFTLQGY